jgi:hypothetical protein
MRYTCCKHVKLLSLTHSSPFPLLSGLLTVPHVRSSPFPLPPLALFAWLISHQPAVLFSQNKSATSNQPAVLFSQNKAATSNQPPAKRTGCLSVRAAHRSSCPFLPIPASVGTAHRSSRLFLPIPAALSASPRPPRPRRPAGLRYHAPQAPHAALVRRRSSGWPDISMRKAQKIRC